VLGRRRALLVVGLAFVLGGASQASRQPAWLGAPQSVATGVEFFATTDRSLVDPAGPVAAYLLKLDPRHVRLESALSNDEVMGAETVDGIAARHHAVAAINGGFFDVKTGEPVSLLKVGGELVSDSGAIKGAVVIQSPPRGRTELWFDQLSARQSLKFKAVGRDYLVPVDGVDTTRARGKLMLYTPKYHADTDTALNGTEWTLDGKPFKVIDVRPNAGHTPIPRAGAVLSFGGLELPDALAVLAPGVSVAFETRWKSLNGLTAKQLDRADAVVNGAGLLRLHGKVPMNWVSGENLVPANFINMRHPRTLIGVDAKGFIWLAAIDGRQPEHSVGMMFADLERLCDRLGLTDALNLDGGGSTTMVVGGKIVNKPSDATGPRPVSDAILVTLR
jgi:phosphodiester glycosidase